MPCCTVPTGNALSGAGVTEVGMAVALAWAAAWEAPLARLAVGTLATCSSRTAQALASHRVTLVAQRALWVAVTSWWIGKGEKNRRLEV